MLFIYLVSNDNTDADKMYTFPIGSDFDKLVDLFDRERR